MYHGSNPHCSGDVRVAFSCDPARHLHGPTPDCSPQFQASGLSCKKWEEFAYEFVLLSTRNRSNKHLPLFNISVPTLVILPRLVFNHWIVNAYSLNL
jgi:hypothetical protein